MKEIITSGSRKFTIKLDDEDYEKIIKLPVPLIYTKNHPTNPVPYVLPEGYGHKKKELTSFLYPRKSWYKLVFSDEDSRNLQSENVSIAKIHRKKVDSDDEENECD